VVADEPKVDMAANLALWGEAVWFPSVLATDPRVRWEPVDAATALLVVPGAGTEDRFTVRFDAWTGLIQSMEALRYKAATSEVKIPWQLEPRGWQTVSGQHIPSPVAVTWGDEGRPWLVMTIDDALYNVDVARALRATGP
jgi:hypothetical protein